MIQITTLEQIQNITQDFGALYQAQILQPFLFDHHMPTRKVLTSLFQNEPFRPLIEHTDVKQLIKAVAECKSDVLIVWGIENPVPPETFLQALQQLPRQFKTHFILNCGSVDDARFKAMSALGLSGYVLKPVSMESMRSKIEEVCKIPTLQMLEEFHTRHY